MMKECLPQVDVILELLDARIPISSKNPEIDTLASAKPRIVVLTKASLANPEINKSWIKHFNKKGITAVLVDSTEGSGIKELSDAVRQVLKDKLSKYSEKGMEGRRLKAMIVGIPNVGKSSLINRLAGAKRAKVEDRPGVTLNKQWVTTEIGLDLLDMPGVLWPKFEDEAVGYNLAMTGAIRDQILDIEEIAMLLCSQLIKLAPNEFMQRYKISSDEVEGLDGYDLFELVGRKRGMIMSGGVISGKRCAEMLLDEFRGAKIGKISLEIPGENGNA